MRACTQRKRAPFFPCALLRSDFPAMSRFFAAAESDEDEDVSEEEEEDDEAPAAAQQKHFDVFEESSSDEERRVVRSEKDKVCYRTYPTIFVKRCVL